MLGAGKRRVFFVSLSVTSVPLWFKDIHHRGAEVTERDTKNESNPGPDSCSVMGMAGSGEFAVAWFKCFIRGENFPGQLVGRAGLLGFYTTRFVKANDAEAAESDTLQSLRADPRLAPPSEYTPTGKAKIYFEEIEEITAEKVPPVQPGFAWHPM
jgi:hypothetical protein